MAASEGIRVDGDLQVAPAGNVTLFGPKVQVNADITAHGGSIRLGNVLNQITANGKADTTLGGAASVILASGARLDTSGLWSNLLLDPNDSRALAYLDGGSVSLRSSGSTLLGSGSLVDVSSGAALLASGKLQGGKGGNLTLAANANTDSGAGVLGLGGELRGQGRQGRWHPGVAGRQGADQRQRHLGRCRHPAAAWRLLRQGLLRLRGGGQPWP